MNQANLVVITLVCLCATSGFSSQKPPAGIPFPVTPSPHFGQVETDLLRTQQEELSAAESSLTPEQKKTREQKNSAVSRILQAKNTALFQELDRIAEDQRKRGISGLTEAQAKQVLLSVQTHPVVGPKAALKYDTWDQMIGYCFGRAAYIHWELLKRGVTPEKIGKIFAVGGLRQKDENGFHWDYHLATIVRSIDSWWVIDPLIGKIMEVKPWVTEVSRMSTSSPSKLRFYLTDAIKLHPIPGPYRLEKLLIPEYRGYFQDLFDWFRDHPTTNPSDRFFP